MLDFAVYVCYMPSRRLRRLDKPLVTITLTFPQMYHLVTASISITNCI